MQQGFVTRKIDVWRTFLLCTINLKNFQRLITGLIRNALKNKGKCVQRSDLDSVMQFHSKCVRKTLNFVVKSPLVIQNAFVLTAFNRLSFFVVVVVQRGVHIIIVKFAVMTEHGALLFIAFGQRDCVYILLVISLCPISLYVISNETKLMIYPTIYNPYHKWIESSFAIISIKYAFHFAMRACVCVCVPQIDFRLALRQQLWAKSIWAN